MHHDLLRRVVFLGVLLALAALVPEPTAADAENVALGKDAWANSSSDLCPPSNAVDGNLDTFWDAGDPATQTDANWICVDLRAVYSVDSIVLTGNYSVDYLLYGSRDGTDWGDPLGQGTLVDTESMSGRSDTIGVGGREFRYVWFIAIGGTHSTQLAEFEVNAVPEPSTLALLGIGAFGLLGYAGQGLLGNRTRKNREH
jgi:hypothetical protein